MAMQSKRYAEDGAVPMEDYPQEIPPFFNKQPDGNAPWWRAPGVDPFSGPDTPGAAAPSAPAPRADYVTKLDPQQEAGFQEWVKKSGVPFDPSPTSDYDMRGFYKALQSGDPNAQTAVSGFDGKMHFPDTYKTPYHKTFSNESMYASGDTPHWEGNRLVDKSGRVVSDETPRGSALPVPLAPPGQGRYDELVKRKQEILANAPVQQKPKWWQNLAAGAAGAAAGYENATGRTRPIDANKLADTVRNPGYSIAMERTQSQLAPVEAQLETQGNQNQAWWKNQAAGSEAQYKQAEAQRAQAQAKYFQDRSGNQWKADPKTGELFNTTTGQRIPKSTSPDDLYKHVLDLTGGDKDAALQIAYPAYKPTKEPATRNLNAGDILLHPQDFAPAQVNEAKRQFDREHRAPVVNVNTGATGGGLDEEAITQAAAAYNAGAGLPNLGFGKESAQIKKAIMNRAATLKPGNDLAGAKQDYAATGGVLKDLEKNAARVKVSEGTATKNLDLADTVSQRVDRTGSPIINKYLLYLKGDFAGDDDTQLLHNAVETAANEYAGVVSAGSGGGVAATDSAREHARAQLHSSMAKGTLTKVVAQMKTEMANRRSSFDEELKSARSGRGGGQAAPARPSGQPEEYVRVNGKLVPKNAQNH